MKQVWKCGFCEKTFLSKEETAEHEKNCGKNPANRITDKTIFRLAMIYHQLSDIIATSVILAGTKDLQHIVSEINRAGPSNCPFTVYEQRHKISQCINEAQNITRKRDMLRTTKFDDIQKNYPEMVDAITKTLQRPAWNEW